MKIAQEVSKCSLMRSGGTSGPNGDVRQSKDATTQVSRNAVSGFGLAGASFARLQCGSLEMGVWFIHTPPFPKLGFFDGEIRLRAELRGEVRIRA
jgi:hypothetical protein